MAGSAGAGTQPGLNRPWVIFFDLPGDHDAAEHLATKSAFGLFGEGLAAVWEACWADSAEVALTNRGPTAPLATVH